MNNYGGKRIGAGRPSNWNTPQDVLLDTKDNQMDIRQLTAGVIALIGALKSTS